VVTVSDFSKEEIRRLYRRSDVAVTPNAAGAWVTARQRRPASADPLEGAPFFLTVGSRAAHKDLGTAYDAFARYRAGGGQALLAVVGSSHRSLADAQTDGDDRHQGVVDLGRVSDEELAWLYGHASAFVFPTRYEGFGIPPIEAQMAGTPVIASDIPVLREVLSDESVLRFPPGDSAALARAMAEVDDPLVAARLVAAGAANAARYTWSASAAALSDLIDALPRS
jgi:glycosyltransferase involved in cell wall biosynthesis